MNKDIQAAILRAAGRFIGKRIEALEPRFKALETRAMTPGPVGEKGDPGERGQAGAKGIDGKDADTAAIIEKVHATVAAELPGLVSKAVGAIPAPVNGKDGAAGSDGKSVTLDEVLPAILPEVRKAIAEIPKPENGKDGRDGERGADGKSVTAEEVAPMLKKMVDEIPRPKDGDASGVILELIGLLNAAQE